MKRMLPALLCMFALPALPQSKTFDAWGVGVISGEEGLFAATSNESGAIFGQFCYVATTNCVYLISNDTTCEEKADFPVLVNSDLGSKSLQVKCIPLNKKARYVFTDFDAIDKLAVGANRIGFAFPLESGRFHVTRFDLAGSDRAIAYMRTAAEKIVESVGSKKARDLRDSRL